jgi:hypothetical protein
MNLRGRLLHDEVQNFSCFLFVIGKVVKRKDHVLVKGISAYISNRNSEPRNITMNVKLDDRSGGRNFNPGLTECFYTVKSISIMASTLLSLQR